MWISCFILILENSRNSLLFQYQPDGSNVRHGAGAMPGKILWLADHLADIIRGNVNSCTDPKTMSEDDYEP